MVPVARSGSTTSYHATMTEVAAFIPVPAASSATPLMDGTAAPGTATAWSRGDHIHPVDATRAPLASPALTGSPTAPTVTPGSDSTTKLATTAFVQSAITAAGSVPASAIPATNFADNSGFAINQRAYVSATALAAGVFGHDRWKAGSGGCTYTFTQSGTPTTTITITAGTLQQVIEGLSLVGGSYALSWSGTAQGRIGGGSYAASPVTATVTAGTNTTIEFNTGTLSQVKLEIGTTPTNWLPALRTDDLRRCQRFYQIGQAFAVGYAGGAGNFVASTLSFPVTMRAAPTLTTGSVVGGDANVSGATFDGAGVSQSRFILTSTAAGMVSGARNFTASADL
jgi:hypothetical protein